MLKRGLLLARKGLLSRSLQSPSMIVHRSIKSKSEEYDIEPMLPPDYPILPKIVYQKRNPWIYDDQQDRRNFDEPLHETHEDLTVWGPDVYDYPAKKALMELVFVASLVALACYIYLMDAPQLKATRRSYPFDGLRVELGNDPNSDRITAKLARRPDPDE